MAISGRVPLLVLLGVAAVVLRPSGSTVALWLRFAAIVEGWGPVTRSVSKSTITFKGPRRGFAGARPSSTEVIGYFDLMRPLPVGGRIRSVSPYGRKLFVHHFRVVGDDDLDAEFEGWLEEAYAVGCGAHLD